MKKVASEKSKRIGEGFLRKDVVNRRAHGKATWAAIGKRSGEERYAKEGTLGIAQSVDFTVVVLQMPRSCGENAQAWPLRFDGVLEGRLFQKSRCPTSNEHG